MSAPKVDVLAVMDAARNSMGMALPGSLEARRAEMAEARAAVAELIEAHKESIAEIEWLRDAMFRVYAVAANGSDTTKAIEAMRDEMDKPWTVDRSRAALARIGGAA